jgi:hypothetical protein
MRQPSSVGFGRPDSLIGESALASIVRKGSKRVSGEAPLRRGSAMSAEGIPFEPFAESPEPPLELALG